MDPLADVLDVVRVRGALLAHVRTQGPWGLQLPSSSGASFHAVCVGGCWLQVDGEPLRRLMPGDALLLPTGIGHRLLSDPGVPARPYDRVAKQQQISPDGDLVLPGQGACTRFICAGYDYDHSTAHRLVALLPPVLHLPAETAGADSPVQVTLRLLTAELGDRAAGSRAVVDRLIDVLFVQVVRAWLQRGERDANAGASWLRALRDPDIAGVLALLHDQPERRWTIGELARAAHMSRATLLRRFTHRVGEPPIAYLTRWRMDLAAQRLRDTSDAVAVIAKSVGHTSEHAFSRAFTRALGQPPGRYRAQLADA